MLRTSAYWVKVLCSRTAALIFEQFKWLILFAVSRRRFRALEGEVHKAELRCGIDYNIRLLPASFQRVTKVLVFLEGGDVG